MDIERVKTGIANLDELVHGGFPKGSAILIAGGPGSGKTVLSAQFIYNGVQNFGEKGVYAIFGETGDNFKRYMKTLGFDFEVLEKAGKVVVLGLATTKDELVHGNVRLILDEVRRIGAKRLVIDSITSLMLTSKEALENRVFITILQRFFQTANCTTLLIAETPWGKQGIGSGVEEFIADGIILMESFIDGTELRRRLIIPKMRGTGHDMKYYRFTISEGVGIKIIPYPEARGL